MMPRKRKRSHFKDLSVQRAKAPRSTNPDENNESNYFEGALCARCAELEIPKVLPSLDSKKVCTQEVSSKVLQRLVFDSLEPYVPRPVAGQCTSCDCLYQNRREPIRLRASQVYKIGMGVTESRKRYSNSWFAIRAGNELARCTDKYSQQYFSRSDTMLGWQHIKNYNFSERYIPFGSKLQSGTARKMLARPNYTAVKAWLDYCSQNHPKCQHLQSDALKLISLIDVDRKCLVPYPSNKEPQCDYIALSYVWGDSKIQVEKHGEILDRLPQTIHDSIEVVRQLGKKYLWVDSICIDQSNPTEKMAQIRIMDTIYEGAFATIIALSGTSAADCLPGVGGPGQRTQQIYAEFGENLVIQKLPDLVSQVRESVWATRAWTYQEGLLSRRCLFFTEFQIYFVCNKMDCCESLNDRTGMDPLTSRIDFTAHIPHFIRDPLLDLSLFQTDRQKLELLENLINEYTRRHLSRDDDSLNAISALLRYLQQVMFSDGFLCGLPLANFRKSLLWRQNSGVARAVRRNTSLIPSWSWAGWKLRYDISFPLFQPWIGLTYPPLKIIGHEGKEINLDGGTGSVHHPQLQQDEPEHSVQNQDKVSATLAFYKGLESQTICDLTAARNPCRITSNPCDLLVEGIILKFPLKLGGSPGTSLEHADIVLPDGLGGGAVYLNRRKDKFHHKLLGKSGEDIYQDFLLVSTTGDKFSKLRIELLYLFWEGGVAFRGGAAGVDIDPGKVTEFWDKCNTTRCRFWFG